jgi:hypothetical protein
VRIALCGLFNKLNQALQIEIEDSVLADMLSKGIHVEAHDLGAAKPGAV